MNHVIVLALIFLVLLSVLSSLIVVQNASALAPVAQITWAKADNSDLSNGGIASIAQGKSMVKVSFAYRGFDDNNHIIEIRCSWDGINYLKSNCFSESPESRTTFTGPDGVDRAYYVKTGAASRELALPPVPKTYSFGVKVLNDGGTLSPASTWIFRIKSSDGSGSTAGGPTNGGVQSITHKVTVKFDSITINEDHDPDTIAVRPGVTNPNPGEWQLVGVVQGKLIGLFGKIKSETVPYTTGEIKKLTSILGGKDVLTGKTYNFPPGTQMTVSLGEKTPLSIFTFGRDYDCGDWSDAFRFRAPSNLEDYLGDVYKILSNPNIVWLTEIEKVQQRMSNAIVSNCSDEDNILGGINVIYPPPRYQAFPHSETTSNGDFLLRYTITVS